MQIVGSYVARSRPDDFEFEFCKNDQGDVVARVYRLDFQRHRIFGDEGLITEIYVGDPNVSVQTQRLFQFEGNHQGAILNEALNLKSRSIVPIDAYVGHHGEIGLVALVIQAHSEDQQYFQHWVR